MNALRAFEATARHLSFKEAAAELNVTPAALSHQIKGLEAFLGLQLFRRLSRSIELTDAGRLCYPGIHAGFEQIRDAVSPLIPGQEDNVLVISAGPAFSAKWLAPRLYRFIEKHPEFDARISANLRRMSFGPGGADVAIRFGHGNYPEEHVEPFLEDSATPMCSPHILSSEMPLRTPEDLRHHTLIHDDSLVNLESMPSWQSWLKMASVEGVDVSRGPRFNHANHGLDAAIAGTGVVLGRTAIAGPDLSSGRLVAPLREHEAIHYAFYFVCAKDGLAQPKIRAFHDWLWEERERDRADAYPV